MRENGAQLTGKKANFGVFAVLTHPMIEPLNRPLSKSSGTASNCSVTLRIHGNPLPDAELELQWETVDHGCMHAWSL